LQAALAYARTSDVIVVHTLDRLGRTVRDTLNLIHELAERGVGVRNLADPIKVDSTNPADPMAQLAVVLLALFGQMERTYTLERAAHAHSVATAKGRRIGRPVLVDPAKLAYAAHLRDTGHTITEITAKTGIARTSLYRHLPPRPPEQLTVAAPPHPTDHQPPADHQAPGDQAPGDQAPGDQPRIQTIPSKAVHSAAAELLEAVDWPDGYRPPCPACTRPTIGLREHWVRRAGVREPVVVVRACPCGCAVDEHAAQLQQAAPHTPGSHHTRQHGPHTDDAHHTGHLMTEPELALPDGYRKLLEDLKRTVAAARWRTQRTVNTEPLTLYWRLGGAVLQRQHAEGWGTRVIDPLATDLRAAFPDMRGLSRSNTKYLLQMAGTWTQQARWLSWRRRAR